MAAVEKRGKNQWRVRVRRKGQSASRTFDTKFEADAWARETESGMDRSTFRDMREAEATTLGEALDRWEAKFLTKLAATTQASEAKRVRHLKTYHIASLPLARIRGRDVTAFIEEREVEGCRPDTIRLDLALIRRVFTVARSAWSMEGLGNPVSDASTAHPRVPEGRTRRLEEGEEEKLLAALDDSLRPIVLLALATAMRRSEIAGLTWGKVRLDQKVVTLLRTKNGDTRSVPLSTAAVAVLEALPMPRKGPVFGLDVDKISERFGDATRRAGLADLRFHDLRHEATSRLFENTRLDAIEIAKITGHKTMQMLARYTHLRAKDLVERLG